MTRVFTDAGKSEPVSVIHVEPNVVTQVKTTETDGYNAIQVSRGTKKRSRVNKPMAGHFAKAGVEPGVQLCEFRVEGDNQLAVGAKLDVSLFNAGELVDVTGTTKGKGFQGVIKRHHFAAQDATHGNSLSHRAPGSIGQRQSPGRVFPGKKMSGHMGDVQRTIQSLEIIRVDAERNLLLVRGAIPGAPGGSVIVKHAVKAKK
jgi:large subunit ribosomal protein L3